MKKLSIFIGFVTAIFISGSAHAQSWSRIKEIFPKGTKFYENIPYANDTLKKHTLDIYLPPTSTLSHPLIVWIHGGAWMSNDKHADMSYMTNTIKMFMDQGFAMASIDYRWSTTAPFPAQILDCNQAIEYIYKNANLYNIDASRLVLIGFSAGGHLASLIGLSNNNRVREFYPNHKAIDFKVKLVLDFYGPSDLRTLNGNDSTDPNNPLTLLLGGRAVDLPEVARKASPIVYVDPNDPPFLIVQGEKDESVNPEQSKNLSERLTKDGVKNELIIVPGAPHYGKMFDSETIRASILDMLKQYVE